MGERAFREKLCKSFIGLRHAPNIGAVESSFSGTALEFARSAIECSHTALSVFGAPSPKTVLLVPVGFYIFMRVGIK